MLPAFPETTNLLITMALIVVPRFASWFGRCFAFSPSAQRVHDGDAEGRPPGGATGDLQAQLHATYERLREHQGNTYSVAYL